MKLCCRSLGPLALAVMVALPLLGMSGVASATAKAAKGCHKTHSCKGTGSGTGSATPPPITVQVDPNPLVETGQSEVVAVVQVETSPSFAGDPVEISSSQLESACSGGVDYISIQPGEFDDIQVILDDDGNATVLVSGLDCAPGPSLVEADLVEAPYYTATTTLSVEPPNVTTAGVSGYPATSGIVTTGEVETGDTPASGDSDVYGVFYVETNPVYAELPVEISSAQLVDRCDSEWESAGDAPSPDGAVGTLDDDGNAVFFFLGSSCAAGPSQVVADVDAGTHPTYTTTFNVVAPTPTI